MSTTQRDEHVVDLDPPNPNQETQLLSSAALAIQPSSDTDFSELRQQGIDWQFVYDEFI
jgi:hypothetical protein